MASKIGKVEWFGLYILTGVIDAIQFFGDLLLTEAAAAPEIVNAGADPFIGLLLGGYLQFRGCDIIHKPKRIISLMGIVGLEELSGGIAPGWIVDVWYIHRDVKKEEAAMKAAQAEEAAAQAAARNAPLYAEGRRRPISQATAGDEAALNQGGRRNPQRGGIPASGPSFGQTEETSLSA